MSAVVNFGRFSMSRNEHWFDFISIITTKKNMKTILDIIQNKSCF